MVTSAFDNQGLITTAAGAIFHGNNAAFTNSGRVQGLGTVRTAANDDLLNNGVLAPGFAIGTLTVDGDLTFGASGRAQFELTSAASFDKLSITDDVTFTGTLEVLNLGYSPVLGDSFRIITFDQRLATSTFANLTWTGFGPDVVFTATYNLNDVTLNVTAVPEPGSWALLLVGLCAIGRRMKSHRR